VRKRVAARAAARAAAHTAGVEAARRLQLDLDATEAAEASPAAAATAREARASKAAEAEEELELQAEAEQEAVAARPVALAQLLSGERARSVLDAKAAQKAAWADDRRSRKQWATGAGGGIGSLQ